MSARRPAPRPKRGGEEFARRADDGPSSKKPRFDPRNPSALIPDAPEEDAVLDADEIGKRGQQTKRNAVNIDGYQSDSSNEGFDARANAKTKATGANGEKSKAEEDNDMFADLEEKQFGDGDEDEELGREGKKKKKDVRFLEVDEIEGQDERSEQKGHIHAPLPQDSRGTGKGRAIDPSDEEDSSDSDVDDEVRADVQDQVDEEVGAGGKKRHAPKIDAFNLKGEKEEGGFDEQMNYVRKARDPDAVHDTWLEGLSKKDMKKAKEAEDKRDQERRKRLIEANAILTQDILAALIPLLERGETVLEALARLGRGKKKKPKWQSKKAKGEDSMDLDAESKEAEDPKERKRRKDVEVITEAADQLLTRGQAEIYEAERELLVRQYKRETGEDWVDPPKEDGDGDDDEAAAAMKQWEYRWSDKRDGGEPHGPYDGNMMVSWSDAGYFGDGVEFRRIGDEGWERSVDFV